MIWSVRHVSRPHLSNNNNHNNENSKVRKKTVKHIHDWHRAFSHPKLHLATQLHAVQIGITMMMIIMVVVETIISFISLLQKKIKQTKI